MYVCVLHILCGLLIEIFNNKYANKYPCKMKEKIIKKDISYRVIFR